VAVSTTIFIVGPKKVKYQLTSPGGEAAVQCRKKKFYPCDVRSMPVLLCIRYLHILYFKAYTRVYYVRVHYKHYIRSHTYIGGTHFNKKK